MIGGGPQKITVEIGGKIAASLGRSLKTAQMQVSSFGRNVTRTMNDAATAGRKGFKGIFDNALWQQATIGATAFAGAIGLSVKAAMEFDKSLANVRKAIDFKDGEKGLKRFSGELIRLSGELPYTAAQLTEIAAAAGLAGYAENEILPFTRAAAQMGIAFEMTAAQAGEAMVALRASMGLTQPQVGQLGDAINHLSDRFQGTVNAADLTEVTRRIGAIGKAAGLTAEEIAGLGAAFLASGTPAEVAATGLKNFLNALTKGEQATKSQVYAMTTLFGGDGMADALKSGKGKAKAAAKEAGFDIAGELAKGMQTAPEATIKSVLERMAKLPKEQQVSIAGALFGEESKAAIMPLLTNTKLIGQAFDLIREKQTFAGSMQKEFKNQMGTTAAQTKIFQNGINALGISIGAALLPSLNSIMKAIGPVLVGFGDWAQKNQWLMTGIVLVGGALAGLVVALPIIAGVISSITTIGTAIAAASPIIAGLGTVFVLLAAPIGIAVAAIAAVAAGAFLVIRNWQPISGFFAGLWQKVVSIVQTVGPKILAVMTPLPTQIIRLFTGSGIGQRIIGSIIDGLKAKAGALFGWIGGAWAKIKSMVGQGEGAPDAGPTPPGRATGGRVRAGMPYTVGERRRELFVPGMDGAIIPRIARPVTAGGGGVTINAPVTIHAAGGNAMEIRDQVRAAFEDLMAMASSGYRVALND